MCAIKATSVKNHFDCFLSKNPDENLFRRLTPPSTSLYMNYRLAERKLLLEKVFTARHSALQENKLNAKDTLNEFESNRRMLFDSPCSVMHLHKQNKAKINRNSAKFDEEVKRLEVVTSLLQEAQLGFECLSSIEDMMAGFLDMLESYFLFFKPKSNEPDDESEPFDLINFYKSIVDCYNFISLQYDQLISLITETKLTVSKNMQIYLNCIAIALRELNKRRDDLKSCKVLNNSYNTAIELMKHCGYSTSLSSFSISEYKINCLKEIITFGEVGEEVLQKPFSYQLNVIRQHINILKSVASGVTFHT